ncbi:hypothetical protein Pla123a_07030 [Posidoniimonas polymericola]|uniref:PEP-CTERM protein-sorting domain-containing protein n=1 Tax=Posidoniimonas polymericola TaxID=2528002 RepID=A0A5C5ZFC6_9BACT|nr:hypothetical protein [Posidoniimonas polymericola]TWT85896.1 hypothetical protein Pla123a_07030 [Posidoniimonas polymericola]
MRVASAFLAALAGLGLVAQQAMAVAILSPADTIIGVDFDGPHSKSSYPGGENPGFAIDGTASKYLNFAGSNSGFIVTPSIGSSTVQSMVLTSANDDATRDPTSFQLFGTNDPIVSLDNSLGIDESWTPIDGFDLTGGFEVPAARNTVGPVIPLTNAAGAFTSYKLLFPTVGGSNLMQIGEVDFFASTDGTGSDLLTPGDPILAIDADLAPDSEYPGAESPAKLIDGDGGSKYLNFGKENAGFIVTPAMGAEVVKTFRLTTANDAEARDPSSWQLYGTNDPIQSLDNSQADGGEVWTLLDEGAVALPTDRNALGPFVKVDNDSAYASYMMVFPTLRDVDGANSLQFSEVQFFSTSIPEPTTAGLALLASICGMGILRGRRG